MPYKIFREGGKYCVYSMTDAGDKKSKKGCHDTEAGAKRQQRALYVHAGEKETIRQFGAIFRYLLNTPIEREEGGPPGVTSPHHLSSSQHTVTPGVALYKDQNTGTWFWAGIVSNNRLDKEDEILTTEAHEQFVQAVDSGLYKEIFGHDYPELWLWHIGIPIGDTAMVALDQKGYLIGAGVGRKGEFYDKIFEGLSYYAQSHPLGMSHGMPAEFVKRDIIEPRHLTGYLSKEFTFLPLENAANEGTGGLLLRKAMDKALEIPAHKRQWLVDTFGEEMADEFGERLADLEAAANAAGTPQKEISMTDQEVQKHEEEVEVDATVEAAEDAAATVEQAPDETEVEADDVDAEAEESEDVTTEDPKEYISRSDLEAFTQEVIKGVKEPYDQVRQEVTDLRAQIKALTDQIAQMRQTDERRIAEKAQEMPVASLSSTIAQSIIGNPLAEIKEDDPLFTAGPEEAEDKEVKGATGIGYIDEMISKQRGRRRTVMATVPGLAQNGQQ